MNRQPGSLAANSVLKCSSRTLIALAVSAALPGLAFANAARVDFAIGSVQGVSKDGTQRRLMRGSRLQPGDTVITRRGRAQLRFSDGAYTSLAPNTEFRIDEYVYEGNETETSRSFFSLVKGGLRTITGAIGRLRKKAYRLSTPVATIGIRGTGFVVTYSQQAGMSVTVGEGGIEVCSSSCSTFGAGSTATVGADGGDPQSSNQNTTTEPPSEDADYSVSNDRNDSGQSEVVAAAGGESTSSTPPANPVLTSSTIISVAAMESAGYGSSLLETRGRPGDPATGQFDSAGALTSFNYAGASDGGVFTGAVNNPSTGLDDVSQAGGVVGWGRWLGSTLTEGGTSDNYVEAHYAAGIPTVEAEVPSSGTATFTLVGGTKPAMVDMGPASATVTELGTLTAASLGVDFSANTVSANITATFASDVYSVSGLPLNIGSDADGSARPRNVFGGKDPSTGTTSSSFCSAGCSATIEGFFAGSGASHAGITYKLGNGGYTPNNGYVLGAAGFQR